MTQATRKKQPFQFSEILLKWNKDHNSRQMPWKGEKDPYKVWVSEIILQQTRVDQGLKYYENFIKAFPDINALAKADDRTIYKYWEGLGYYSRCRNLIETARHVSFNLGGKFPEQYEEIKKLKGIGPYTSAAIASFAFNQKYAVVDGNVFRLISRIFGIDKPIDSTEGKTFFATFADKLLDKKNPGVYNQAIMDFGAVICKPVPSCQQCPFKNNCHAFKNDRILSLPVKTKKIAIRKRWFDYILFEYQGKWAIRQRNGKDIWSNLFEFMLIESNSELDNKEQILTEARKRGWLEQTGFETGSYSEIFKQQLTHQRIEGRFVKIMLQQKPQLPEDVFWVRKTQIRNYAFPKFINQFLLKSELN